MQQQDEAQDGRQAEQQHQVCLNAQHKWNDLSAAPLRCPGRGLCASVHAILGSIGGWVQTAPDVCAVSSALSATEAVLTCAGGGKPPSPFTPSSWPYCRLLLLAVCMPSPRCRDSAAQYSMLCQSAEDTATFDLMHLAAMSCGLT